MTVPDEAIAVVAKWLHDHDCRSALHSGFPADFDCYDWLDEAKELLEAAAPYLRAQALEDAAGNWSDWDALQAPEDWLRARAAAERGGDV